MVSLVQSKSAVPTTRPHGIEMQRGDVLYIPRGFPHMAETTGGNSSVHFTMTVMSQEFTWESFLLQLGQPGPAAVPDAQRSFVRLLAASFAACHTLDSST